MAVIKLYQNGTTAYNPSGVTNKNPPKRRDTIGWSSKVSSRLKKWLYSIPVDSLTGHGLSFTLTVRTCPESSDDWANVRNSFVKRLFRHGCIRLQWLTEWQSRGVPHIHGIAYFDSLDFSPDDLIDHWLQLTSDKYGSLKFGQDSKPIHSVQGWMNYLAKHAARGSYHYQRSPENIPSGWIKTGRMWGHRGSWVIRQPMQFNIDQEGFYQYRRLAKKYYLSNVRSRFLSALKKPVPSDFELPSSLSSHIPCPDRLSFVLRRLFNKSLFKEYSHAKSSLKSSDSNLGRMMGVTEWIDIDNQVRLITFLGSQGYKISQVVDD